MFKSDEDIKKALIDIRKLKDYLDDNVNNPMVKEKVPKDLKGELERLRLSLSFFNEFNNTFFKALGIDDQELNKVMQMNVPGRDPKAQALFQEADRLRCELLLSQAKFIQKNFKDYLDSNKPFEGRKKVTAEQKDAAKKKVKKKFKSMKERMKWNKM